MTIESDLLASLTGDATLTTALAGGVHEGTQINRNLTPAAFDANKEILPCALLKMEVESPIPPHHRGSRKFVTVYLYQRVGYDVIRAARDRIYVLWHEQKVGEKVWQIFHTDDVNDQEDGALECSLIVSRFAVVRSRA
jgi:hypothetical protein